MKTMLATTPAHIASLSFTWWKLMAYAGALTDQVYEKTDVPPTRRTTRRIEVRCAQMSRSAERADDGVPVLAAWSAKAADSSRPRRR